MKDETHRTFILHPSSFILHLPVVAHRDELQEDAADHDSEGYEEDALVAEGLDERDGEVRRDASSDSEEGGVQRLVLRNPTRLGEEQNRVEIGQVYAGHCQAG